MTVVRDQSLSEHAPGHRYSDLAVDAPGQLRLHHHHDHAEYPHSQGAVVQSLPPQEQGPPADQPPPDVVCPPVRVLLGILLAFWAELRTVAGASAETFETWQRTFDLAWMRVVMGGLVLLRDVVVLAGDDDLRQTLAIVHLQRNVARLAVPSPIIIPDVYIGSIRGAFKGGCAGRNGHISERRDLLLESVRTCVFGFALVSSLLGPWSLSTLHRPFLTFLLFAFNFLPPPGGPRCSCDVKVAVV